METVKNNNFFEEQGDKTEQFMRLYMAVQPRVYGFIVSMIHQWNDADDILQETVSVMWRKFGEFETGTDFASWALSIARFQVLSYYQKLKTKRRHFSAETLEKLSEQAIASEARDNHFIDALKDCITKLPQKECKLLKMRYEVGTAVKDLARRTNQNVTTVYKKLNRLHAILLNCIHKTMAAR